MDVDGEEVFFEWSAMTACGGEALLSPIKDRDPQGD